VRRGPRALRLRFAADELSQKSARGRSAADAHCAFDRRAHAGAHALMACLLASALIESLDAARARRRPSDSGTRGAPGQ
jgi:hypothetical protein